MEVADKPTIPIKVQAFTEPQHIMGMRLMVSWFDAHTYCMHRDGCKGCPYKGHPFCQKMPTTTAMMVSTALFRPYLEEYDKK